jgi:hypothetical protein
MYPAQARIGRIKIVILYAQTLLSTPPRGVQMGKDKVTTRKKQHFLGDKPKVLIGCETSQHR